MACPYATAAAPCRGASSLNSPTFLRSIFEAFVADVAAVSAAGTTRRPLNKTTRSRFNIRAGSAVVRGCGRIDDAIDIPHKCPRAFLYKSVAFRGEFAP